MISRVSGPHFLALELYFANLFFLFSEYPENLDPVAFGAGGRGEALKSAAPGLTGERSVWDAYRLRQILSSEGPHTSRRPSRYFALGRYNISLKFWVPFFSGPGPVGKRPFFLVCFWPLLFHRFGRMLTSCWSPWGLENIAKVL